MENNPQNKPKTTTDIQDFEMGKELSGSDQQANPAVNKYANTAVAKIPTPAPEPAKPAVNPTAEAPAKAAATAPAIKPQSSAGNPEARKKAILGCLGAFAAIMLIMLILAFVFLAQSNAEEVNPIAKLLGIDQGRFINWLITFVHIIFILSSLVAFIFTMVGLFKASMVKKGDKIARKAGLRSSLFAGITLFIILLIWGFVYIYLDAKRTATAPEITDPIATIPEETLNLSAPIEIVFKAENVPFNSRKYQIVSHEWDFGDGETGTSQIVSHLFKEKGIYNVTLKITAKDKDTGELLVIGEYSEIVSIDNEALAAIFTATPQSGEAPLEVEFDASSSSDPDGTISDFEWDLDHDGEFDDAEGDKITHTFEKIGKYIVSLRVTSNTDEYDIEEKEIVVQEQQTPEAKITIVGEPETFEVGINYVFKADDSTSPNGTIEKYEWDFNDGSPVTETKTASHVFSAPGTYEVTLKVIDEKEEEGEITQTIIVESAKGSPQAKIATIPGVENGDLFLTGTVPFDVSFDAGTTTDSDNNIVDYAWDFDDDGQTDSFGEKVSHTFTQEGNYTVNLTVTDADDNTGKAEIIVKVEAQGIIASLEADRIEGSVPLTVNLDAGGSTYEGGQITSYRWDFGDGSAQKLGAATMTHRYSAIGSFTATVTVIGSDNTTDTATITITVREIPLSACFVSVFENGPAPLETSFDPGCSTGTVVNYLWNFDDGATSTQARPTHVFEEPGEYTVILEVSDANGNIDEAQLSITVTE